MDKIKKERLAGVDWSAPLPLLPLRDMVVFPGTVAPLFVGRPKSIEALDHAFENGRVIMLATQKNAKVDEPKADGIYKVGCVTEILQVLRLPDGTVKALVEGIDRARIKEYVDGGKFFRVIVERIETKKKINASTTALLRAAQSLFERYVKLNPVISKDVARGLSGIDHADSFADAAASHLISDTTKKQEILGTINIKTRLELLVSKLQEEIDILAIENRVRGRVKKQMEKSQRDYYLTEQMKAIQKELGRSEGDKTELEELREKIDVSGMPGDIHKKAVKELGRLEQMPPMSAEGTVIRNYLDWLLDVPWKKRTRDKLDIKQALRILNEDHYGLDEVKERILEYLSVLKLVNKMKGPILCFCGPPGVGKTSLGKSIARAMSRKFVRFSLGGMRDEAEIRGHRRTYIGALPGRIIQAMKKAGTKNPVIMLDEIDKLSSDYRGDPSAALLEALDPEQNTAFNDHYLEVDYDLSEVMFITTANMLHTIPRPLQDRMEIITISGYNDSEKEQIAKRFLAPKQIKGHGLEQKSVSFTSDAIIRIIRSYTREAGVRNLEREIARICRKVARKIAEKEEGKAKAKRSLRPKTVINEKTLEQYLGEIKFRDELKEEKSGAGVATGLAWTEVGGVILKIETIILPGKTKFILTGKLGDVMKESAQAALSYIRSRARDFGLAKDFHNKIDIHVHIPEGATPKDGPSAGIALAASIVSALLGVAVRHDLAMTGEITLRGNILTVGGLKEKLLAAQRAGIKTVVIPKENKRDLKEVSENIKKDLEIIALEHMDEALKLALVKSPFKKVKSKSGSKRSRPQESGMSALN